jgi:DNA polymerase III subunit chi
MAPTEVAFHTGMADKLDHACRLLRKAYRQGARVVVTGDALQLGRLDQALWTFEPQEFVPHARLRAGQAAARALARTPIWFVDAGAEPPHREVLVNLGPDMAPGSERYARVIELVAADADDRAAGQQRWRAHKAMGHNVVHAVKG